MSNQTKQATEALRRKLALDCCEELEGNLAETGDHQLDYREMRALEASIVKALETYERSVRDDTANEIRYGLAG